MAGPTLMHASSSPFRRPNCSWRCPTHIQLGGRRLGCPKRRPNRSSRRPDRSSRRPDWHWVLHYSMGTKINCCSSLGWELGANGLLRYSSKKVHSWLGPHGQNAANVPDSPHERCLTSARARMRYLISSWPIKDTNDLALLEMSQMSR
jgi:hypothetical protein